MPGNQKREEPEDQWGSLPGRTPYWLHSLIVLLQRGVFFQIAGIGVMMVIVAAFLGVIENPQMTQLLKALTSFQKEHEIQTDGIKISNQYLDRNLSSIQEGNRTQEQGFEDLNKTLTTLCVINASQKGTTTLTREQRHRFIKECQE